MKNHLFFIAILAITCNTHAAGRDNNLQILPEKDYRKPLQEVVVTARSPADWSQERRSIEIAAPGTRLQWLPPFNKDSAESIKPRSQSEEKPLFKIFEKKF